MKKRLIVTYFLFLISYSLFAQPTTAPKPSKPKLVVGLVIDQMRWDFLYRYSDLYTNDGFKRLLSQGFSCENTLIPYTPTYTAVGHSSIYTGSVPSINGIVGNDWFEKSLGRSVYCTDDSTVSTVGSNSTAGKMSPENLWATTITDELRLSNNFKSKVIGVALKDRGAILPAGHSANAAYWYDNTVGKWITSSYYMNSLPDWVNAFNDKKMADQYMSQTWNTLLPIDKYTQSSADDKAYEGRIKGDKSTSFPHQLNLINSADKYEALKATPFGITLTFDFAKSIIDNEKMGGGTVTDFLTISVSSTDYIGHAFGPNSVETEDAYLRLDRDIASFLQYLDTKLGKNNYVLFLTADHGVAHVPGFLNEHKIPAGSFNEGDLKKQLDNLTDSLFSIKNVILSIANYQVYLDYDAIEKEGKNAKNIEEAIIQFLKKKPFITGAFRTEELGQATLPEPIKKMMINGYNTKRSGNIQYVTKPAYFDAWYKTGTTHGAWNPYDAHIPLLWFGWNIKQGKTNRETYMTDIAPTVAAMLKIQMPNGCVGKVIEEVTK